MAIHSLQLEVPVFNGVYGPTYYLRPAMGSRDRVGPIDAKTRLRNALLKKCNEFEVLIAIPYYEWNEAEGRKEKEEEYVKRKVMGE